MELAESETGTGTETGAETGTGMDNQRGEAAAMLCQSLQNLQCYDRIRGASKVRAAVSLKDTAGLPKAMCSYRNGRGTSD